jgi:polyisoprenoid-binding protein YceI
LKSPDFFDAAKYPQITFKSKTFKKVDDSNYKVTGDLTMHGVTKNVELDALCRMGTNPMNKKEIAGFKITGKINRTDFGVGASTPNAMIGDEVSIVANVELSKK